MRKKIARDILKEHVAEGLDNYKDQTGEHVTKLVVKAKRPRIVDYTRIKSLVIFTTRKDAKTYRNR